MPSAVNGMPTVACRYAGMRCAGCGQAFSKKGEGIKITPGGKGMVCDLSSCLATALSACWRGRPRSGGRHWVLPRARMSRPSP